MCVNKIEICTKCYFYVTVSMYAWIPTWKEPVSLSLWGDNNVTFDLSYLKQRSENCQNIVVYIHDVNLQNPFAKNVKWQVGRSQRILNVRICVANLRGTTWKFFLSFVSGHGYRDIFHALNTRFEVHEAEVDILHC